MRRSLFLSCLAIASALSCASVLIAQTSTVAPRIVGSVDESSLTTLKGNVSVLARPEFDQGEAAPATQLSSMRLVLSRTREQEAALEAFMAQQLDKNSPNYHKWLTPGQFGKLYGPADSDVAALVAWLQSHGFTVAPVSPGPLSIAFSGSVAQVEKAFHTSIHSFKKGDRQFYSNTSNPRIPSALAAVVIGIAHLNTLEPRPYNVPGGSGKYDPQAHRFVSLNPAGFGPRPDLTLSNFLWIVPADAATMYDTPNSYNANFSSGTSYSGTGVTIGIGGNALIQASTVVDYRTRFLNGDTTAPTITNVGGSAVAGADTDEAYIDTELAGGLAPGASIHFYTANNLIDAIDQAISDNTVDILSLSFGECELNLTSADNTFLYQMWQQAAGQGIAVTVSTGDNGSAGCDDQNKEVSAADGLQVSGFASTPYNIAVGGTDTYALLSNFSTYVSATNNTNNYGSVLNYIPESTWNDSTSSDGLLANNVPTLDNSGKTLIVAGSGGESTCSTNTTSATTGTCQGGYPKPSWQTGPGVPNKNGRYLPDVSLMAGNGYDNATWVICTDDTTTDQNVTVTEDCATQSDNYFYWVGYGGTSTAAPAFAGILALVEQKVGTRLGTDALQTIYSLFNSSSAASIFHDVTQGNNSVLCTQGSPNCSKNAAGNYFLTGFDTGVGYDEATGIGSVDATNLVNLWVSAIGSATATVTATPTPATIAVTQKVSVAVSVAGSGGLGTPTGTVALSGGGYTASAQTLVAGAFTFNIPADSLAVGSDKLTITYNGDSSYAGTTGTTTVTVNAAAATVAALPSSVSFPANEAITVKATVTGSGPTPTGTVSLSGGGYSAAAQQLSNGSYTFNIPANSLSTGNDTLTITYSGDSIYASNTGTTAVDVTATLLAPSVSVTPASNSINVTESLNVAVKVTGTGATPTGSVTLTSGSYSSVAKSLSGGAATISIPAGALAAGNDTLSVAYSGDANYTSASGSGTVKVTLLAASVTVTPASSGTFDSSQSEQVTVAVAGAGPMPTGTVTLSGSGYTSKATALSSGSASITIPANTFSTTGSVTLTATYSGDAVYATGTGTANVTVNSPYKLTTTTPAAVTAGNNATATITVTADSSYSGSVTLGCALATSPTGAQDLPTCSVTAGSPVTITGGAAGGTATVTIATTAPTLANLDRHGLPGWAGAGGGAALALLVFFGIPARRRSWRNLIGLIVLMAALGSLSACGGGGGNGGGGGGGGGNPGTTAGPYTFTVTGTGNPAISPAPTVTVSLTVN